MSDKELVDVYASIYKKEEVETVNEVAPLVAVAAKTALKAGARMAAGAVANKVKKTVSGGQNEETVTLQTADGKDAIEVTDVVSAEPLKETQEALEERLWDQVAANLTTLGEMGGVKFKVVPVEEVVEEEKVEEEKVVAEEPVKEEKEEGFHAKANPVRFSKKEEVVAEDLTPKYASNILKADALIKEGANEIV
tara:strand:+ start:4487 stop:5068 length:582 start_codon:yes stop_codon:yes gene_type:complete